LAPGAGLHVAPDSAAAFAWYCPADPVARGPDLVAEVFSGRPLRSGWADRLRRAGVTHLVVYEPDPQRRATAIGRLLDDPITWPLLSTAGGVAVFGWRDPARSDEPAAFAAAGPDPGGLALPPGPG